MDPHRNSSTGMTQDYFSAIKVTWNGQKCPAAFPVVGTSGDTGSVVDIEELILDWVVSCSGGQWQHSRENPPLACLKPS